MARRLAAVPEVRKDRRSMNGSPIGLWRQHCEGTSKRTGQRCGLWAMPGQYTCMWHGGATKAAQAAGRRRIAELARPGIDTLQELLHHEDPMVRLKATEAILDRVGEPLEIVCERIDAEDARREERRRKNRAARSAA